jgi:hypothetical protein
VNEGGVRVDLLVYHDMTVYADSVLTIGADAGAELGELFAGYRIVAIGPPIHSQAKDVTVVLAHGDRPMKEIQALLDAKRDS